MIRSLAASSGSALLAFVLGATACATRTVDLGGDGEEPPASASPQVTEEPRLALSQYGCDEWIDEEMYALREGACGSVCASEAALPYALESKKAVMSATAGRWAFCQGELGPRGAVGIELVPGCRVFFLRYDVDGRLVRGTEAAYQASYDIVEPRVSPEREIDLHLDGETSLRLSVTAHRCPEQLRLVGRDVDVTLARDFAEDDLGDPTR